MKQEGHKQPYWIGEPNTVCKPFSDWIEFCKPFSDWMGMRNYEEGLQYCFPYQNWVCMGIQNQKII